MTSRSSSSRVIYHIPPCHVFTAGWCFGNIPIILQPLVRLICILVHTLHNHTKAFRILSRVTSSLVNVTFVSSCTHFFCHNRLQSHHLEPSCHQSHLKHVVSSDWLYSTHRFHSHTEAFRIPSRCTRLVVSRTLLSSCARFVSLQ
jgi:hypothetical protein